MLSTRVSTKLARTMCPKNRPSEFGCAPSSVAAQHNHIPARVQSSQKSHAYFQVRKESHPNCAQEAFLPFARTCGSCSDISSSQAVFSRLTWRPDELSEGAERRQRPCAGAAAAVGVVVGGRRGVGALPAALSTRQDDLDCGTAAVAQMMLLITR